MNSSTESACAAEDLSLRERPRYFPRQLITPEEMTLEQEYFRKRLRLHNRLFHGWGVVCGAMVWPSMDEKKRKPKPWEVVVKPGYLLGPYGDEIVIDCERVVDLRQAKLAAEGLDPRSRVPPAQINTKKPHYLAVKSKECLSRPVRVPPLGCGCDETRCEYSRWLDGYEIGLLDECPASHGGTPPLMPDLRQGDVPLCPECPQDPWVVLAKVDADAAGIPTIDNYTYRRMVLAIGPFWWSPTGSGGRAATASAGPPVAAGALSEKEAFEPSAAAPAEPEKPAVKKPAKTKTAARKTTSAKPRRRRARKSEE